MKKDLKIIYQLLSLVIGLSLQGCVSFDTGPECVLGNTGVKTEQLSVQSVSRVRAKIESSPSSSGVYILRLIADGRFVLHKGYSYGKVGTPCMSVGLWPGYAGNEHGLQVFFGSIGMNYGLLGIPTLISLFIEPFCEYRERGTYFNFADFGLIGFNKYYRNCRKDKLERFQTESTTNVTSYELYGFTVVIDGNQYEDKDFGSGYNGKVYFHTTRPSGSQINIRIIKAPSVMADSKDSFSGMEGMEIPACLP